jgi:hypothetical protein
VLAATMPVEAFFDPRNLKRYLPGSGTTSAEAV